MADTKRAHWDRRHSTMPPMLAIGDASLGSPFNAWMYRVRRGVFLASVAPALHGMNQFAALDIGSGTGFYVDCWSKLGAAEVIASDLAPTAVRRLRRQSAASRVLELDITSPRASLPARIFDAVSAMDILFHITDDAAYARAIRNLASLCAPGGIVVVSENFRPDRTHRLSENHTDRSEMEIFALLRKAGLDVLARHRMFMLMNEPQNSRSRCHRSWWATLSCTLARTPQLGALLGPVLYPLERWLVKLPAPGPSVDLLICRRRGAQRIRSLNHAAV